MTLALLPGADARLLRDLTRPPRVGRFHCGYCGARCWGRVCRAHRDLLELEAEPTASLRMNTVGSDGKDGNTMARLPGDDVLDALVDIFDPHDRNRYQPDPALEPGWRIDLHTGERVYSSCWLNEAVEGHERHLKVVH